MLEILSTILFNLFCFIVIISVIVFIHEFGHFYVARLNGVLVEEFSIGFGKKIFSFRDKKKTIWKFCLLPFGGYVKMFGDKNGASVPDQAIIAAMTTAERKISFINKNVYQRIAIVGAGPLANFILAIFLFTILFQINGVNKIEPIVSATVKDSPSFQAGLQKGDKIIAVNDDKISDFYELRNKIVVGLEKNLKLTIERNNQIIEINLSTHDTIQKNAFDEDVSMPSIGMIVDNVTNVKLNILQSFIHANAETFDISLKIFKTLGQLISGQRSIKELGGPIKIAKYSGKTVELGLNMIIWFTAMISINLGVMNLLPVPVLDGGHLFFYTIEALRRGKPIPLKYQNIGYNIGFAVIVALMIFTTINDVIHIIK